MTTEPMTIVYRARNLVNGKTYIGYTGRGLAKREASHRTAANQGRGNLLQAAMRKYGHENIVFEIMADFAGDEDLAKVYECEAIAAYKPEYNLTYGGEGGTLAEESRRKISAANTGRKMLLSHSEKRRAYMTGRKHTPEAKAKIAAANLGRPSPLKGVSPSEETRRKLSVANKGQVPWTKGRGHSAESKAKMSAWQRGRKLPDAHKANISTARRAVWADKHAELLPMARALAAKGQAARRLAVRCVEDGLVFAGCSDADRYYGYRVGTVSRVVKGTITNTTGRTFVRHEVDNGGQ